MLKDLRHGVRVLLHAKGWTAVVVISLALGIGANTALFSAVNGLLLRKLPVSDPDGLVRLRSDGRNDMATSTSDYGYTGRDGRMTFSYAMFQQFVADNRTMTDLFACAPFRGVNVVVDGQADIATGFISTGNYYRVLGVTARLGRTILPEDDQPGAPPVTVISHRYWRSRFAGDPLAIGKSIQINGVPIAIVGVLPPEFTGVQRAVDDASDVAMPLSLDSRITSGLPAGQPRLSQPTYWWLQVMGRLKPGVTAAQVQANLETVFERTARSGLESYLSSLDGPSRSMSQNQNRTEVPRLRVDSGSRGVYDVSERDLRAVTILSAVVALVPLIVCANVANLLLSRATAREKEMSVRLSMGATRARLVRQLLTESVLLASLGGALGVLVGYWGQQLLPGPAGRSTPLEWRVLAFVLAVTMATGILFGIAPALRATRLNLTSSLKESSRGVAGSRSILGKSLLVVQVAISLVLLTGAGLFLRTVQNLRSVDVGFNPRNLVLFSVSPRLNQYDDQRVDALYQQMIDRLRTVPGVRAVALSQPALLTGAVSGTSVFIQGRNYPAGRRNPDGINRLVVSPGFFEAMEIRLLGGRAFTERDTATAPKVVIVNEAAVAKYFANVNPIGQRFGSSVETSGQNEIVGVVRDVKYDNVRDPAPPTMFVPYLQNRPANASFEVRMAGDPLAAVGAIRETVRRIDPNLPLMNVSTQLEQIERRFLQEKVFAQAYALFGGLAVLLASIGLFGLMSYSVARRTNEIGIRIALGARRQDVLRLVMGESMILVIAGVAIGLAIAAAAGRFVASLLFGLAPTDVGSMLLAMTIMLLVSAFAGYLPARRAVRVDPIVALHYE